MRLTALLGLFVALLVGCSSPVAEDPSVYLEFVTSNESCEADGGGQGRYAYVLNTSPHFGIVANISVSYHSSGRTSQKSFGLEPGTAGALNYCSMNPQRDFAVLGARYVGNPDEDVKALELVSLVDTGACKHSQNGSPGRYFVLHNNDRSRAIAAIVQTRDESVTGDEYREYTYRAYQLEPGASFRTYNCSSELGLPVLVGARFL